MKKYLVTFENGSTEIVKADGYVLENARATFVVPTGYMLILLYVVSVEELNEQ